jgi:hypothetical protein
MLVGYNTNVTYKGNIYHIQTEDSGLKNPVIVRLLYSKGAILASKKTSYEHILDDPDFKEKVRRLMKAQHKIMIKELLAGKYTGEYTAEEVSEETVEQPREETKTKNQITKSLDDILLNYIIKRK